MQQIGRIFGGILLLIAAYLRFYMRCIYANRLASKTLRQQVDFNVIDSRTYRYTTRNAHTHTHTEHVWAPIFGVARSNAIRMLFTVYSYRLASTILNGMTSHLAHTHTHTQSRSILFPSSSLWHSVCFLGRNIHRQQSCQAPFASNRIFHLNNFVVNFGGRRLRSQTEFAMTSTGWVLFYDTITIVAHARLRSLGVLCAVESRSSFDDGCGRY